MSQAGERDAVRVDDALFIPPGESRGRMHIQVLGQNFVARAVPLMARLGRQMVTRIVIRGDGSGFAGILEAMPQEGDRLYVGYADGELQSTNVVYRGGAGQTVV